MILWKMLGGPTHPPPKEEIYTFPHCYFTTPPLAIIRDSDLIKYIWFVHFELASMCFPFYLSNKIHTHTHQTQGIIIKNVHSFSVSFYPLHHSYVARIFDKIYFFSIRRENLFILILFQMFSFATPSP